MSRTGKMSQVDDWRSQNRGETYVPFLSVRQVPSKGLSTRVLGWKTRRVHHFFSRLEENYFYTLEWSAEVIDIREQFPLPLEATIAIAAELGISHPPQNSDAKPMTSDFVISVRNGTGTIEQVRTVKPSKDLASERTLEKLEIERRFWQAQKIDWRIVTEQEISIPLVKNVKWFHAYQELKNYFEDADNTVKRIERALVEDVKDAKMPLSTIAVACDDRLGQREGTSLTVIRHLLATRRWKADMSTEIDPCQGVKIATA